MASKNRLPRKSISSHPKESIDSLKALIATQAKLIKSLQGEKEEESEFDDLIETLQGNLRMLRAKKGMSQMKMSFYLDINNGYISKLESGKGQNPSLKILFRFSKFFDCPISKLLGE